MSSCKSSSAMVPPRGSTEGAATEFEYVRELSRRPGLSCSRRRTPYTSPTAATMTSSEGRRRGHFRGGIHRHVIALLNPALTRKARSGYFADRQQGQCQPSGRTARPVWRAPAGKRSSSRPMQWACQHQSWISSSAAGNLTAAVFLPKFAAELKKTFGDVRDIRFYGQPQPDEERA